MGSCISVCTCACVRACVSVCVCVQWWWGLTLLRRYSSLMVFFSISAWPHSIHRLYLLALINRTTTLDIDANMGCKIKQNYVRMLLNSRARFPTVCKWKKILTCSISTPLQLLDLLYIIVLICTKNCLLTNTCCTVLCITKGKNIQQLNCHCTMELQLCAPRVAGLKVFCNSACTHVHLNGLQYLIVEGGKWDTMEIANCVLNRLQQMPA